MYKLPMLAAFLLSAALSSAQTAAPPAPTVKYSGDKFLSDTIPGVAMVTDSIIRMVPAGVGFRFEKVLSTIVVDLYLIKTYRFLVRASDAGTEPFDMSQSFHLITGGLVDPRRIMMFKQHEK